MSIHSEQNPKFKHVRQLLQSSQYRSKQQAFVLETPKLISDFYQRWPDHIDYVLLDEFGDGLSDVAGDLLWPVASHLIQQLSSLHSSPGVLAVCRKPVVQAPIWSDLKRVAILDGIQDPKNAGAIIRNAVAFGLDAILMSKDTVDLYHPETIRAMAGAGFHLPVLEGFETFITELDGQGFTYLLLDRHEGQPLNKIPLPEKMAFVLGSEGQGVSDFWGQKDNVCHGSIPISDEMESLNVAVASGIAFYLAKISVV